ncbi:protein of unknown function DUF222 [Mycobacterium sp. JS623]|uniref:HNH endonuclease signature motif containing protein n=1 Tax=Mycobacterium sp. JS623 TaxID=212767 RepID=UPI0002A55CBA|nr:HNH endonuclease signature motif containing protein [Mycobacterium sp. JS623]AGB21489.1 protein of unknown function DUF222 [Mycobacterium sp. JS623]
MFDSEFSTADDATVVAAIEEGAQAEAAAGARRLAAIAELARRRAVDDDERANWAFDGWASAAAEVAAAMTVGHRRASREMRIAVALRDRLPRVAALHMQGTLSSRVVSAITWRTQLVEDAEALALIDAALAEGATKWGPLSEHRLDEAIDAWIFRYDPAAVRRSESSTRTRDFSIGDLDDPAETTSVWGRLLATDAAVLKRRVAQMVQGVCDNDPRPIGERRSDAVGAIAAGDFHLACRCGSKNCPAGDAPSSSNVVIRVLAEQSAVDAATSSANAATASVDASAREQTSEGAAVRPPAALIVGEGIVPTPLLAELIRGGAKVRPITMPSDEPEPHYRPSAELAEFVRMRDLYCRAPGCDVPADRCDLDHTIPYPVGPTHASNIKCLCRTNHLMKTCGGWRDIQLPDGTVIWISPSGRKYITKPGSRLFFETWDITTADLPPTSIVVPNTGDRGLMMPRRRRTRAAEYAARIKAERARNEAPVPF